MKNSFTIRSAALPLLVTLALTAFLLPLGSLLHGSAGTNAVLFTAAVVCGIIALTGVTQIAISDIAVTPLQQMALVGGLRMVSSLGAIVAVCVMKRDNLQPEMLLCALPFYLGLLTTETIVLIRDSRPVLQSNSTI